MEMNSTLSSRRVVLVTGAAGGLGRGLVGEFARQGWYVAAAFHRSGTESATEQVWPVPLDVTQVGRAEEVVDGILERWGRLDVLVNNAGCTADRSFWQISPDDWDRVLAVNLKSAFLCARAALGPMLRQREGHIISISSWSGRSGGRGQGSYAAAKAGLLGWTAALAKEVGSANVRVNAILPGVLPTPMTAGLDPETLLHLKAANALDRLNSVEEVARFTVFLAELRNVSGQVFQLDSRIGSWA